MGWIVGIVIALFVLIFALHYWYITLPLLTLIFAIYVVNEGTKRRKAEEAARHAEEAARHAEEAARLQRYREEQNRYREEMTLLCKESLDSFESLPRYVSTAERHMDQAERDFGEGVFAPFWDSIEASANVLGRFNEGVRTIKKNSARYTELVGLYASVLPRFPVALKSVSKLEVGTTSASRMAAIVRIAQRNFQFATIYEQRKTNQILVSGFTNLAQALAQMTSRITSSIEDLSDSIGMMASTIDESTRAIHSRQGAMLEATVRSSHEAWEQASEQAKREEKALEMLDNIQRGRKPLL
jgi:hypothetical protein